MVSVPFSKILIANRGEIACRVAATARRLGIRTVAVYSDADAQSRHVAACDEAVRLGPAPARESYLRADAIVAAARATGAQAVHPGYGFLSENEAFAQACAEAGIAFIGPPASAIAAMGSKSAAKALMEAAGVPLVPGYHGEDQDPKLLAEEASRMGFPVLIKASAGGGGKGMRIVRDAAEFDAALASCKREAAASFGDDRVLVERYLEQPRHIEIQVFADTQGNCVYLFERDCSVQRRHQKVLEEAPAPGLPEDRRRAMGEAAVAAARAVGYVGAGTVEFIATQAGDFFFMEMNTRLQVEHPVTEMVTGFDLVEWQLRVAAGQPLPVRQDDLRIQGHSIEARLYAESPERGFLPSTGRLAHLRLPEAVEFTLLPAGGQAPASASDPAPVRAAVRIDAGVREGDEISPYYDPMIAKLIVHGADRAQALARLADALARVEVVGVRTNAAFLHRLVTHEAFAHAQLETGLIEKHRDALLPPAQAPSARSLALAAGVVLAREANATRNAPRQPAPGDWRDPWSLTDGWRALGALSRTLRFEADGTAHEVSVEYARLPDDLPAATVRMGDGQTVCVAALRLEGSRLTGLVGDGRVAAGVVADGETLHLFDNGEHVELRHVDSLEHAADDEHAEGGMTAPMPGKVIAVMVSAGDEVAKGAPLLVMEAMKMEHTIAAPADGKVASVRCAVGDQVAEGAELVSFEVPA